MDIDKVRKVVAQIDAMKGEDEMAHSTEDDLHVMFIDHVSKHGDAALREMALEILKTRKMEFMRRCA